MNPTTTHVIYGPPGTGKTTTLLGIVDDLFHDIAPSEVCFITFTRRAAQEAKQRAMKKFALADDQLPWFRTLHSLAFSRLGVTRQQIMGPGDYLQVCQSLGLVVTLKGTNEDGTFSGLTRGDRLLFTENMSRTTGTPLRKHWEMSPDEDIHWYELERFARTLLEYKDANGKYDFTDLVQMFVDQETTVPGISALIVDEAQDLSPLQWTMVKQLAKGVGQTYIAGDDDQAIFRWAGADVEQFMGLPGNKRVLPQSYRVPAPVMSVATGIVSRIQHRIAKSWQPSPHAGSVTYVGDLSEINMSVGSWLLLARNVFLLDTFHDQLLRDGRLFESSGASPISGSTIKAIRNWERLRAGNEISVEEAVKIYGLMSSKVGVAYGFKTALDKLDGARIVTINELIRSYGLLTAEPWDVALDKLPETEREYFKVALSTGDSIETGARIRVSTIHGAKGAEADNVVIITDMAQRTFDEMQLSPDDEHRVWYVAVTRARHHLYIIQPTSDKFYTI